MDMVTGDRFGCGHIAAISMHMGTFCYGFIADFPAHMGAVTAGHFFCVTAVFMHRMMLTQAAAVCRKGHSRYIGKYQQNSHQSGKHPLPQVGLHKKRFPSY